MFNLPKLSLGPRTREIGTYVSGALVSRANAIPTAIVRTTDEDFCLKFAISYFILIDAQTLSSHAKPPPDAPYDTIPVRMTFVDWIPAIISTREYAVRTPARLPQEMVC
jgi:hypothetical protein